MQHKRYGLPARKLAPIIILALLLIVLLRLQSISDFIRLYRYTPPAEVAALADQTTMTETARKYFYVNHPAVADRKSFNEQCNSRGEHTIVLGCYHAVDRGIYLFDVTDPRIEGVEQVTAAHEMLHAAYDRLNSSERKTIDSELEDFFRSQVHDERILNTIEAYKETEPEDLVNEMHSIFATEITSLTPSLEKYYGRYFSDRSKVVAYAQSYQKEFTSRQDQVKRYDAQLLALKKNIDTNSSTLKQREADIQALQRQMEAYRNSGNNEAYNSQVPVYNARVDSYNSLIQTTQGQITEYNRLVAERNSIALQVRELTQSINSQLTQID